MLLILSLVVLAAALMLLGAAVGVAREQRERARGLPRRLYPHAHAVYVDMNGVQPYALREALYRAGVQVLQVQPPALQKDDPPARVFVDGDGKINIVGVRRHDRKEAQ